MGGDFTQELAGKRSPVSAAADAAIAGSIEKTTLDGGTDPIEIHFSDGEAHFHNRNPAKRMACRVEVTYFRDEFDKWMKAPVSPLVFTDAVEQTKVTIAHRSGLQGNITDLDVDIAMERIHVGSNLSRLVKFREALT